MTAILHGDGDTGRGNELGIPMVVDDREVRCRNVP